MRLDAKIAVVTGGASGIGEAIVRRFVDEGASVVVADVQVPAGQALADELGGGVVFVECDVTRDADVERAAEAAVSSFGRLDVFCNNAGAIGETSAIDAMSVEGWDATLALNLRSAMLGIKHAAPRMSAGGGGSIVCLGSAAGLLPRSTHAAYAVAKAGVAYLTRVAALQLAPDAIRVNCVAPGLIATPGAAKVLGRDAVTPDELASLTAGGESAQPLRTPGEPADIAGAVLYLASDDARLVTGVVLPVDGGSTAGRAAARRP
jgi:NAD(P)-dependent dehydrogenase (short-subunit alcohol dehydrogenase family)